MNAIKYLKEKHRICSIYKLCGKCPLGKPQNGKNVDCTKLEVEHTEKTVEIVEKWSKEHPQKTILQDFLERFPNVTLSSEGIPNYCALHFGYLDKCEENCSDCWNSPLVEGRIIWKKFGY